ncbi:MAG: nicotinate-nucleotide adenylyltransferase [Longimicrobiaceae bacterium]
MTGAKVGVLGGTFDPPHAGHLIAAGDAFERLQLDRLLFVPALLPPHKQGAVAAPAPLRLELVRAAVAGDTRFEVDDLETRRPGPSYTVDTLAQLRGRWPRAELFLLVGADTLAGLPQWREPERVLELATLALLARQGEGAPAGFPFPFERVPVTRVDVSSSELRRRVAAGLSIRYRVPEQVLTIIEREGVYGKGKPKIRPVES